MTQLPYLEGYTRDTSHSWVQEIQNPILRLDFSPNPLHNINPITKLGLNWSLASKKLHENHSKAVDIAFLIHLQCVGILWAPEFTVLKFR